MRFKTIHRLVDFEDKVSIHIIFLETCVDLRTDKNHSIAKSNLQGVRVIIIQCVRC